MEFLSQIEWLKTETEYDCWRTLKWCYCLLWIKMKKQENKNNWKDRKK